MKRLWVAVVLSLACAPSSAAHTPAAPPTAEPPSAVDEATADASAAPQKGVPIELDVPLISGESEALANLRGKVIVLLLSSSDRPGWSGFRAHYEARLQEVGRDRLVVVAVANDPDPERLKTEWDRDPPPFLLGWDPDGALALRLGVATLPAVFVLDSEGKAQGSLAALDEAALDTVDAWVNAALSPR